VIASGYNQRDNVVMKKILIAVGLYCVPMLALAHTKWFADGALPPYHPAEPTWLYLTVWGLIATVIVGIGYYFQQHQLFQLPWLKPHASHEYDRAAATFAMVTGAFLLIAGTHDYLFSPNQGVHTGVPMVLIVVQILIGLAFLLGIATRSAALVLTLVWLSSIFFIGFVSALENIWVLSTATFIAIMGNDYFSLLGKSYFKKKLEVYKPYALSVLRLGTGATLLILGFSEKILEPEYGINFLNQFHWNFMALLGFHYSDYLFVISAGSMEALFGFIFILGVVTRLNALVVAIFFTIPMFILGPIELAGHMPHFAAVVLLLLFGSGDKFMFVNKYKDATWGTA
jgi:uncharacterized membrane protein YphA (DoxX/SURF4 family)